MKRFALLSVLAALFAFSGVATAQAVGVVQEPPAEKAAVASWPVEAGTYEYTRSDGRTGVNTLKADGTYSNVMADGAVETGRWSHEGDLSCLVSDEGGEKRFYAFTRPDAEGNFTGTLGEMTITVRKVA